MHVRGGDVIDPDQGGNIGEGSEEVAVGGHIGAHISHGPNSQAQNLVVPVQREFRLADIIAGMFVG